MVAIDVLEGFEHQVPSSASVGVPASSGTAIYSAGVIGGSISYTSGRLAGQALHVVESGSTHFRQDWPASTTRVFYGWFRVPSAPSFDRSSILVLSDSAGTQAVIASVRTAANGSVIEMQCGTGTRRAGPNISDNAWHLLEFRFIGATTSWTVDWAVDGSAQTQATFTGAAANTTLRLSYGSTSASHTCTVDWDDVVGSVTSGDYQISSSVTGGFAVRPYLPTGEGTDVIGTTNAITFTGASTGWECTDEWPADDSTYITYASTTTGDAASNYAEITMANLESDVTAVWAVYANLAAFANGTGADVLKVRALDSSNNILSEVTDTSFDVSETTLRYWRKALSTPGGGFLTDFNGFKFRVGLSTDTNAIPRASALMLQAAVNFSANADHTTTTVVSSATFPAPTSAATAALTTTTVASTAALYAPTVAANADITTTTVAAVTAIPTPDVVAGTPNADVTTTTVAAVAAVPSVTVSATAAITSTAIAAVAATYTPTVAATAAITTTSVASLASVPAPTAVASIAVTTTSIASTATIPSVTVAASAAITTTTVAAVAAVPTPVIAAQANASVTTTTVVAVVALPAVTTQAEARASPSVIAALAATYTPTVAAPAAVTTTTVAGVASVPAPTVAASVATTTTTVAALAAVPTPTVAAVQNAAITTTTVAPTAAVPTPTVVGTTPAAVTTTTIAATASIPSPTKAATAARTTVTISRPAVVFQPTTAATATRTTTSIAVSASIPASTITMTAAPTAGPVAVSAILPAATVAAPAAITTTTVAATTSIPQPVVFWTAESVPVTTSVPTPTVVATAEVLTETVAAPATIPEDVASTHAEVETGTAITVAVHVGGAGVVSADMGLVYKRAGTMQIHLRAGTSTIHKKAGSLEEVVRRAGSDPDVEKRGSA